MARAKFTPHGVDSCTVEYVDPLTGEKCARTFVGRGAYVWEVRYPHQDRQACEKLGHAGVTLHYPAGADLTGIVRREYKRLRADSLRRLAEV